MSKFITRPAVALVVGMCLGAGIVSLMPQESLNAATANSSDKFSIATVPVEGIADTEAVFVLDHLTGLLRGGRLNNGNAKFTHQYLHSVAEDFELPAGQRNPEYSIVSGNAQLNARGNQPARGVLYVAEKSSGQVVAYGFALPMGRGAANLLPLVRLDSFAFREAN